MPTKRQTLGETGEILVVKHLDCPSCKRGKSLKRLPTNFKCADVVCDFCGYLAQVKTSQQTDTSVIPSRILGAAWAPQEEMMKAGIFFPLFFVLIGPKSKDKAVYYLSADLQTVNLFVPRKPLSSNAKRAGWQGFMYDFSGSKNRFVRMI